MSDTIDIKKIDAAFQDLADTPEGNAALDDLAKALDAFSARAPTKGLNSHELNYLLTNLVNQRRIDPTPHKATAPGTRVKSGFAIKTAVEVE